MCRIIRQKMKPLLLVLAIEQALSLLGLYLFKRQAAGIFRQLGQGLGRSDSEHDSRNFVADSASDRFLVQVWLGE